jgi:hypothetical protein
MTHLSTALATLEETRNLLRQHEAKILVLSDPLVSSILSQHPDCECNIYFPVSDDGPCNIYLSSYFYNNVVSTLPQEILSKIPLTATDADSDGYVVAHSYNLLSTDEVKIHLSFNCYFDFPPEDKETLFSLGKLKSETSTRTYLSCEI